MPAKARDRDGLAHSQVITSQRPLVGMSALGVCVRGSGCRGGRRACRSRRSLSEGYGCSSCEEDGDEEYRRDSLCFHRMSILCGGHKSTS